MSLLHSQRHRIPRPRLIGEEGWAWIKEAANGAGLILFMAGAIIMAQHAPQAIAWLRAVHIGLVAGNHIIALSR